MVSSALTQLLVLLAFSLLVVAGFRRLDLPPILGYLAVGMLLGPHVLNLAANDETTRVLAEFGVVFLVFTLGLEFSLPRMMAMRWEVLGLGGAQVILTTALIALAVGALGTPPLVAIVLGGALAMSSTAIVIRQLADQSELNRTHSRLAVGILLFQDLAFVPFLALESALSTAESFDGAAVAAAVARAAIALLIVLAGGRWLLRPLFHEIGRARSTELFTLAVLFVALASAWATQSVGLSMALGAFLAGMLLAETEYRHQIEVVIRPFRDILLGLFFISVGMLLDFNALWRELGLVVLLLVAMVTLKAIVAGFATRLFVDNNFKAIRTGVTLAVGGEFGIALLTLLLQNDAIDPAIAQPLLVAVVLGMVLAPVISQVGSRQVFGKRRTLASG